MNVHYWPLRCLVLFILAASVLLACDAKKPHPYDVPVSHWLNDPDPCTRLSAKAIIESGRPYPNEVYDAQHKLIRYDVWIADQLYELSGNGAFLRKNVGSSGKHDPWKYMEVAGTIEEMLNIPKPTFKDPRINGAMRGTVYCEIGRPASERAESRQVFASTRAELIRIILEENKDRELILKSELFERPDLKMTEIVSDLKSGGRIGSYIPYAPFLSQMIGDKIVYKKIGCGQAPSSSPSPYDPDAVPDLHRTCSSWIYLRPGVVLQFSVPQQYLPFVPALHDHLIETFAQSRRK